MRVPGRVAAPAVFDEDALDALAGNVRQLVLVDQGHLGVLRLRLSGEGTAERQGGDKQRIENALQGALSFAWRMRIRLLPVSRAAIPRDRCAPGPLPPTAPPPPPPPAPP